MRRRQFIALLAVLALSFCILKFGGRLAVEDVREGEMAGSYPAEWYEMVSRETNEKGIQVVVDGEEKKLKTPVRMAAAGGFLIPVSELRELFSCTAHTYDDTILVMEKTGRQASIAIGESEMTLRRASRETGEEISGENIPLDHPLTVKQGQLSVPAEALAQAFDYDMDWDAEQSVLSFTSQNPEEKVLPRSYDYRMVGRAPAVKNQGSLGTCWAFASLMALESRLLPEQSFDFSEDHMSLRNSFQMDQNDGGDYTMSMAYLLSWQGPVLESEDPYGDSWSPEGLSPALHLQEIQILPEKNYEAVKEAVYFTGGVQSSLYTSMADGEESSDYYNKEEGAYCYTGDRRPNHDVVIIGWDDDYPKENFPVQPEGDGAFICANSWGGAFGEQGYFYVSYYDTNIGIHNIVYSRADSSDYYDKIYQTDLCGWVGQLGYGKEDAFFANIYQAKEDEELWAAGFYATDEDTQYEVYVVNDAAGSADFGRRRSMARGKLEHAGYYTIDFPKPAAVKAGERFAVIVSIRTPGSIHPVAIEYNAPDKKTKVDLSDGEGYISLRGTAWDRVETEQNCNVCLKAYTRRSREQ